ncbi:hypothetical protein D350_00244 [Enterococcus faecalis VC1B-1]|nr:hypothetical protein D350_00244 [Enterococcus faecalis VC1B-1]
MGAELQQQIKLKGPSMSKVKVYLFPMYILSIAQSQKKHGQING